MNLPLWTHLGAVLTAAFLVAGQAPAAENAPAARPNIVYILADDLGYNDVGFNGCTEIKTPNLDQLARAGTILKSFYAQPVCSPSRAALLTGRYPSRTGVYTVVRPHARWGLPLDERTLAQVLREAGYETALVGKWHLGESAPAYLPTHRGFDHQYGLWLGNIDYFTHLRNGELDWHRDDQPCHDEGYSTNLIATEACRLIREKNPGKPLFLYLAFNAVHEPWQVPERYLQPYGKLKGLRRIYAGMDAAMDEAVGQVLAALDEKGIRDNTLILFSSDNGGPHPGTITDNSPLRAGKATIYEGGVRVCASVNWPGHIPASAVNNEVLHEVDWYPTLVKLAGGSLEQKLPLDGRDIWPVLTQGAKSPHADEVVLCGLERGEIAIRMGDWKLLVWPGTKKKQPKEPELYNLADDLGERTNLAAMRPEIVQKLRTQYESVLSTSVPSGVVASPDETQEEHEE